MRKGRKISRKEQNCISNCIFKYWGDNAKKWDDKTRDHRYESCLSDCRICA